MKKEAVSLGLCRKWAEDWKNGTSKDEMVDKFVDGIDFCIKHEWPSTEVMKRDFGDVIHSHGVYVDETVMLFNPGIVILNGSCDATIVCDGFSSSDIYARHGTRLRVLASGFARVSINMYDSCEVTASVKENSKVYAYIHGGELKSEGEIKVRDYRKIYN